MRDLATFRVILRAEKLSADRTRDDDVPFQSMAMPCP